MSAEYNNGTPVSEIIKEEIKCLIKDLCKKFPNDQDLGEALRKKQINDERSRR